MSETPTGGTDHEHGNSLAEFRAFREKMNAEILGENNLVINRFFALDGRSYEAGALDVKTKELLGLVASLVLRCDDCVTYHLVRCAEEGVSRDALFETLSIGLVVGGSIVIPHLRRAVARWTELSQA
jgi:AhpD family alkylhydroperoxidase